MAATNVGPTGGFSYAQAAKGRTAAAASQPVSSKLASEPAGNALPDLSAKSDWAEEVEGSTTVKPVEEQKHTQAKEGPVDRARAEDKASNGASGISSPDLTASSSTTTKEEEVMSPPNGASSESTWENRSQVSDPSWIAERKERQNGSGTRERSVKGDTGEKAEKGERKGKGTPAPQPPKPVALHEALPPTVNPWLKRAEDAKAKVPSIPKATTAGVTVPTPVSAPTPAPAAMSTAAPLSKKDTAHSQADVPRQTNSVANASSSPAESTNMPSAASVPKALRPNPPAGNNRWVTSSPGADGGASDGSAPSGGRVSRPERKAPSNLTDAPALVTDGTSWPTPDSVGDKERKEGQKKDAEEKIDDATPLSKTKAKKPEWQPLPVTPNFIYDTWKDEPKGKTRGTANGERGGKSSSGGRARGGHRGASHHSGGDRSAPGTEPSSEKHASDPSVNPRAKPDVAGPAPPRRPRASSASSFKERKSDFPASRNANGEAKERTHATDKRPSDGAKVGTSPADGLSRNVNETHASNDTLTAPDGPRTDAPDSDAVPAPIPRRNSSEIQPQRADDASARQIAMPPRALSGRDAKDARPLESPRDPAWAPPRPSKRGGRGRGGGTLRENANGHAVHNGYQSGYPPEFVPPFGVPASPYQLSRGQQYGYPMGPGRGAWNPRAHPRSQSIPIDGNYFQRLGYPAPTMPPHLQPLNTYVPGMYDPGQMPLTAVPIGNQMEIQYLVEMVTTQLEYYFSVDNLLKDMFLRKHMDSKGFVLLAVIANFNRVKQLTPDRDILKVACMNSEIIEIGVGEDGKERLRRADGWQQFLLPLDQREEAAQNDGPEQLRYLDRPQLQSGNTTAQFRGPASAGATSPQQQRVDRRSYDAVYPMMNGFQPQYGTYGGIPEVVYADVMNGEEARGRAARSPTRETPASPNRPPIDAVVDDVNNEPDAFPNEQVDILTVVVKASQQQNQQSNQPPRHPYHSLSSRTFSNGSIDSRSILSEMEQPNEDSTLVNGSGSEMHLPPVPRRSSPNKSSSNDRAPSESNFDVFWVKDSDVPVANLPSDLISEPYNQLRRKALDQRDHAATGACPYDMDVLYQFWCHFLIRNFNSRMYTEFRTYAKEDVSRYSYAGHQNLVKFYAQSLSSHNPIRDRVIKDYVELVQNEPLSVQSMGFKQLRSAWRNGALNLKNRKKLADIVDDKLKEQLDKLDA